LFFGAEDAVVAGELAAGGTELVGFDDDSATGYAARRDAAEPFAGRDFWRGNDTWYLIYTSGTTGKPKAVIQTPGMALANYVNIRQAMSISGDDVCLNYLPLFHTAGINLVTLPTLIEGGEILVLPAFDVERVVRLLADGALDTFFAVPAVYQQISLHADFPALDLSRVRNWGCGGAPMPDHLVRAYLERGARVCNGMGMTETGPTVFIMDPAMVDRKIGSVGKAQVLARVRLVAADGRDVQQGDEGELWFAGPGITPGYWGNPDATRETFAEGGWLKSGDIGRQDADGYYYIAGRIKEMYISGGENVYPAEVENVLAAHPGILEAAVVAIPDDKWGEVGRAYLLAQPGLELPPAGEITAWCRERLAPYKVPKEFVAVQDFPRTAAGKIQKHLLGPEGAS
jgi:fatty-acyl-CoA synthase